MDPKSPGLWLMPTHGRVKTNVPRFFAAAQATGMTTPGVLVVDRADYEANAYDYDALDLPANWTVHVVKGGGCAAATREAMADLFTDDIQWLGWLGDDIIPETEHWDVMTIRQLTGWNVVSSADGAHAPHKLNGISVWSGDLVRAVGYLFPPGLQHMYLDDIWEELGRATGCWQCDMSIMGRHAHASWGAEKNKDPTYVKTNSRWPEDDKAFYGWMRAEKTEAANRIFALMRESGIDLTKPDLSGLRVMIAVPCGDGRYESVFLRSLRETEAAVRYFGGETRLMEFPYGSDIALARAKLHGAFLRSDSTHCFWIDSDQGWAAKDFVRVLLAKRDFVAVAGIRKVMPHSFAVRVADDFGRPLPIQHQARDGLIEASGVGFAFACITRACAERVRDANPDLRFVAADGREEYALFNPIVLNGQYYGEDYSYVHRWRQTGGKVWIAPEVSLQHVGAFCWEGAWLTELAEKADRESRDPASKSFAVS